MNDNKTDYDKNQKGNYYFLKPFDIGGTIYAGLQKGIPIKIGDNAVKNNFAKKIKATNDQEILDEIKKTHNISKNKKK